MVSLLKKTGSLKTPSGSKAIDNLSEVYTALASEP